MEKSCIEVNNAKSYSFDSCYNSKSKVLFLNFRRNAYDSFELNSIKVSFTDISSRDYTIDEIPAKGNFKVYQFASSKNPQSISIDLNVEETFDGIKCEKPKRLFVKDCDSTNSLNIINNPVKDIPQVDLRVHLLELEVKEELWKGKCSSDWECGSWDICQNGLQKRICSDKNNCKVSTDVPDTVRYCSEKCIENWQCSWSSCVNGITKPSCIDVNNCGTNVSLPSQMSCRFEEECNPEISCTNWSSCTVDYNLLNLESSDIKILQGMRSRICSDKNSCVVSIKENSVCSTGVDVYTRKFTKCGIEYVDVYNKLDNSMIARIDSGNEKNPYLNIRLDGGLTSLYCEYCYNGVMDGDETNIDCGGSCISCDKKRGPINLLSDSLFVRIGRWFGRIFG